MPFTMHSTNISGLVCIKYFRPSMHQALRSAQSAVVKKTQTLPSGSDGPVGRLSYTAG